MTGIEIALLMMAAGGTAASAVGNAKSATAARKAAEAENEASRTQSERQALQSLARAESGDDPFADRMAQIRNLFALDKAGAKRTPYAAPANVAPYMPSGGDSYAPGADLASYIEQAKKSIASGRRDPTMTNPNNYGTSGALDLLGLASGSKDVTTDGGFADGKPQGYDPWYWDRLEAGDLGFGSTGQYSGTTATQRNALGVSGQTPTPPVAAAPTPAGISPPYPTYFDPRYPREQQGLPPAGASSRGTTRRSPPRRV